MRAEAILQASIGPWLEKIHAARRAALFAVVAAMFVARKVQLTALGRALGGAHKHTIKKVDRLLGNRALHEEHTLVYAALARLVLRGDLRPIILVDWTDVGASHAAIVAAYPAEGRSIQIYAEVYPRKRENEPKAEKAFLKHLGTVLPANCRPIFVTDAGFRVPWLREIKKRGWDYVARVRGRSKFSFDSGHSWLTLKQLFGDAPARPKKIGRALMTESGRFETTVVTMAARPYARTQRKKTPTGSHARRKAIRSAREPWVLATSLNCSSREVVRTYRKRMQIEESFRDKKSTTLGWSFGETKTRSKERIATLMLVAGLAHFVALTMGRIAEELGLHLRYQANTEKKRRVISLPRLGAMILGAPPTHELTRALVHRLERELVVA